MLRRGSYAWEHHHGERRFERECLQEQFLVPTASGFQMRSCEFMPLRRVAPPEKVSQSIILEGLSARSELTSSIRNSVWQLRPGNWEEEAEKHFGDQTREVTAAM